MSSDNKSWISSPNGFFLPVKVMSRLFRGKFLALLKESYKNKKINFSGRIINLKNKKDFNYLLNKLYEKEWVVYCKPPFGNSEQVLKYIINYVHRVAISNHRIINFENNQVTFKYRDSQDGNRQKEMTISGGEFVRRFLLHILPKEFMKIRYFGFLSNRTRKIKLEIFLELLATNLKESEKDSDVEKVEENKYSLCPECKKGFMIPTEAKGNIVKNFQKSHNPINHRIGAYFFRNLTIIYHNS